MSSQVPICERPVLRLGVLRTADDAWVGKDDRSARVANALNACAKLLSSNHFESSLCRKRRARRWACNWCRVVVLLISKDWLIN